jgi:pre-mRNA-splicing factor 38A
LKISAELVIDRAVDLRYIGGIYGGNIKPTPFLCLTLKMLQLQPDKEIVLEFLKQDDYK